MKMHDVIIAGGGVAGCYMASKLKGLDVLILEKDRKITLKDSGIVSTKIEKFFDVEKFKKTEIKIMECIGPSEGSFFLKSDKPFAYLLKREKFSFFLRREAKKKSEIRYEKIEDIEIKNTVKVRTNKGEHECRLLIGADGASSIVRRKLAIEDPKLVFGIMARTGKKSNEHIRTYFNKRYSEDFYSWVIPPSGEYGLISGKNTNENLEAFRKDFSLKKGKLFPALIPIGYTKSYSNRAILIGDACGMTKPLTGGGIIFSLTACDHAESIVRKAFEKNRFDEKILEEYEKKWKKDFGREIKKQLMIRNFYKKLTNEKIDKLFKDYGKHIENLREFDYDKFSKARKNLPKFKLLNTLIKIALS